MAPQHTHRFNEPDFREGITMSTSLKNFTFKASASTTFELRIVEVDGKPWFAGMDLISALDIKSASYAYARLASDERCYVGRTHLGLSSGKPLVFVSESGLYKLIMRSDKPEARKFQDWVTFFPQIEGYQLPLTIGGNIPLPRPNITYVKPFLV
jgi:prophage antirepressor-like protein